MLCEANMETVAKMCFQRETAPQNKLQSPLGSSSPHRSARRQACLSLLQSTAFVCSLQSRVAGCHTKGQAVGWDGMSTELLSPPEHWTWMLCLCSGAQLAPVSHTVRLDNLETQMP